MFGPLFYLGAMGYGLGSLVDKNGTASLGGVPYVVFVAPAVLAVHAMNTGMSNALFPVFGAIHWNGSTSRPGRRCCGPADIFRGHLMFITMRIAMNSACFVVVMAAFGLIRSPWAVLLLPAAVLTGFAFADPDCAAWAITLEHETAMNYPIRFGAVPLMLFSGTFFPITQLPAWVRPLAYATPLWHGVALCRALSLGRRRRRVGRHPRRLPRRAGGRGPVGGRPHLQRRLYVSCPRAAGGPGWHLRR